MHGLRVYALLDRMGVRNYRIKVMLMAFVGTHIPLIALVSYFALKSAPDWPTFVAAVGITLAATLIGTAITLFVLDHLMRPIMMTSHALRAYVKDRTVGSLPTGYTDEVGTLMADTSMTIGHLEHVRDVLENIDITTGLPNRRKLLLDMASRFTSRDRFVACVVRFVDHGRLVEAFDLKRAEAAAQMLSTRVRSALADGQALYRISRSEFIWLDRVEAFPTALATDRLEASVAKVFASCAGALMLDDVAMEPTLHGGVAIYPDDSTSPEAVVDHAVAAAARASDDLPIGHHRPAARTTSVKRLQLEQELRNAIAGDEFVLHYQPVIDVALGRVVGAEALIRWQHPERGMVPPAMFIGLAETTGLIDPIGLWVMRKACSQIRGWNDTGLPAMKLAINLSARQFLDRDLVGHVDEAVRVAGISPDQLEIELTETAAMADHDYTRRVFGKLRDIGVSIAIDDFGTGYASMSYLRNLPFDKLKIDREFVTNVHSTRDSQAICAALVSLATGLDLQVLAEGTESLEEVNYLWSNGCTLYQGYYFSKPLAADRFLDGVQTASTLILNLVKGRVRGMDGTPLSMAS